MALIQMKLFSASLKTRTSVNVLIPTISPDLKAAVNPGQEFEGFYSTHGNFPVLYLLHGTYGDESDWTHFTRIEDYASNKNVVIVMPSGENSYYLDTKSGKNYETYITKELPAIIQYMFPVSKKREDTFIAGLSMGGTGAIRLGFSHPDLYGYVIGLSASLDQMTARVKDNDFTVWSFAFEGKDLDDEALNCEALATRLATSDGPKPQIYLAVGEDDFLYKENVRFHKKLESLGLEHVYSTTPGAIHDWKFWDAEIFKVLNWLPIN